MRVDEWRVTSRPSLAVGTMTFGWKFASEECDDDVSRQLMESFLDAGHTDVDTAFAYSGGETEKIIGRVMARHPSLLATLSIATKANPWPGGNMNSAAGKGGLSPVGPGRHCAPRHRMPFHSNNEGSKCV